MTDQDILGVRDRVHGYAVQAHHKCGRKVPVEDFESEGMLAVCGCAERYDRSLNVSFSAYCNRRITGAMQDLVRRECLISRAHGGIATFSSLNDIVAGADDAPVEAIDTLVSDAESPDVDVDRQRRTAAVVEALLSMPEPELLVVSLYYYEELNLREVGDVLGVSESRASQIHTKALVSLRKKMGV